MAKVPISLVKVGDSEEFLTRIKGIGQLATYVGIPASSSRDRSSDLIGRASKIISPRKSRQRLKAKLANLAHSNTTSNAQLLYYFSKGSPLKGQPPRPVIEAAIHAPWNQRKIADKVAMAIQAHSQGKFYQSKVYLKSAGATAAAAAREWFYDPRNGWAPNAYATIRKKESEIAGIDTDVMRMAITHTEKEI